MSHQKTTVDLSPGVTVIIGPNNCGKSAVVEALRCLSTNDLVGKEFIRHGSTFSKVTVTTLEGDRIEWIREKTTSRHLLNGRDFGRLGRIVHDDVKAALKMPSIEGIDVHLSDQKDPVFLFNKKPSEIARFFASASDVDLLLRMQRNYSRKVIEMKREREILARNVEVAEARVNTLATVTDVEVGVQDAETKFTNLEALTNKQSKLRALVSAMMDREDDFAEHTHKAVTLANVSEPPTLHPSIKLKLLASELSHKSQMVSQNRDLKAALTVLKSPPDLSPTEALRTGIDRVSKGSKIIAKRKARSKVMGGLTEPLPSHDTNSLRKAVNQITYRSEMLSRNIKMSEVLATLTDLPTFASQEAISQLREKISITQARHKGLEEANASLIREMQAVREQLAEATIGQKCPTCGGELRVDQLLGSLS